MRESLSIESNGPSPSPGILSESFASNNIGITSKTNGVKQIFPAHRHSVDDVRSPLISENESRSIDELKYWH